MDLSEASSPALPPSLAVTPAADDIHRHAHNGRIDDEEPAEHAPRRTRRARNAFEGNIPVVTDPTADRLRERFYQFLTEYDETIELAEGDEAPPDRLYVAQVRAMVENELTTLYINHHHLMAFDPIITAAIDQQYYRFLPHLRLALFALVKEIAPEYIYENPMGIDLGSSTEATPLPADGSQLQVQYNQLVAPSAMLANTARKTKDFHLAFHSLAIVDSLRDMRMASVGRLSAISGTVTRTSEMRGVPRDRPRSGAAVQVHRASVMPEPSLWKSRWLGTVSRFTDWQRLRVQENASDIPTGSIPRSLEFIIRAKQVERAKAGDRGVFTGTFVVVFDVAQLGLPSVRSEIARDTATSASASGLTRVKSLSVRDLVCKIAFWHVM
ncbi:nucleic acid-binding protein [Ceratobasidium sp. AG-I]|nr:nucleic acid-binding protein [Ceratobasidium sp. AG-I]